MTTAQFFQPNDRNQYPDNEQSPSWKDALQDVWGPRQASTTLKPSSDASPNTLVFNPISPEAAKPNETTDVENPAAEKFAFKLDDKTISDIANILKSGSFGSDSDKAKIKEFFNAASKADKLDEAVDKIKELMKDSPYRLGVTSTYYSEKSPNKGKLFMAVDENVVLMDKKTGKEVGEPLTVRQEKLEQTAPITAAEPLKSEEVDEARKEVNNRTDDPKKDLTDKERDTLKRIENAILDGNLKDVQKLLQQFKDDPKGLSKVMLALGDDMKKSGINASYSVRENEIHTKDGIKHTSDGELSLSWYGIAVDISTNPDEPLSSYSMQRDVSRSRTKNPELVQKDFEYVRRWMVRYTNAPEPKPTNKLEYPDLHPEKNPPPRRDPWDDRIPRRIERSGEAIPKDELHNQGKPNSSEPNVAERQRDHNQRTASNDSESKPRLKGEAKIEKAEDNKKFSKEDFEKALQKLQKKIEERVKDGTLKKEEGELLSKLEKNMLNPNLYNIDAIQDLLEKFQDKPDALNKVMGEFVKDLAEFGIEAQWKLTDHTWLGEDGKYSGIKVGYLQIGLGDGRAVESSTLNSHPKAIEPEGDKEVGPWVIFDEIVQKFVKNINNKK